MINLDVVKFEKIIKNEEEKEDDSVFYYLIIFDVERENGSIFRFEAKIYDIDTEDCDNDKEIVEEAIKLNKDLILKRVAEETPGVLGRRFVLKDQN